MADVLVSAVTTFATVREAAKRTNSRFKECVCSYSHEFVSKDNFVGIRSRELLARGCVFLDRTRKGPSDISVTSYMIRMYLLIQIFSVLSSLLHDSSI